MKHTIQKRIYAALFLFPMTVFGAEAAKPGVTKKTLIDTYQEGGWVMHILLVFSIAMVWLIIDIWLRTNSKKMTPEEDRRRSPARRFSPVTTSAPIRR